MVFQELLTTAKNAARSAGIHAVEAQSRARVELKPGNHIVTDADKKCQQIIIETISEKWPEHGFIGEEGKNGELYKRHPKKGESVWWVIDPIDGTRNYAHGSPQFSVSIAAVINGFPRIGVIFDPNSDMLFSAVEGGSAYCNDSIIHCQDGSTESNRQIAFCSSFPEEVGPALLVLNQEATLMNLGSAALHFAYVAAGTYTAALAWDVKLWDIAAGMVIAKSAGAVSTDFEASDKTPIDCFNYEGQSEPILMAPELIHRGLLESLTCKDR